MESKTESGAGPRQAEDLTPTPTQAEADALKEQAHGIADESEPATAPPVNRCAARLGNRRLSTLNCTMGTGVARPAMLHAGHGATDSARR
jgi:hypothetical protein